MSRSITKPQPKTPLQPITLLCSKLQKLRQDATSSYNQALYVNLCTFNVSFIHQNVQSYSAYSVIVFTRGRLWSQPTVGGLWYSEPPALGLGALTGPTTCPYLKWAHGHSSQRHWRNGGHELVAPKGVVLHPGHATVAVFQLSFIKLFLELDPAPERKRYSVRRNGKIGLHLHTSAMAPSFYSFTN